LPRPISMNERRGIRVFLIELTLKVSFTGKINTVVTEVNTGYNHEFYLVEKNKRR